jgi:uncharacterized protein YceH (UPF0502 family)
MPLHALATPKNHPINAVARACNAKKSSDQCRCTRLQRQKIIRSMPLHALVTPKNHPINAVTRACNAKKSSDQCRYTRLSCL